MRKQFWAKEDERKITEKKEGKEKQKKTQEKQDKHKGNEREGKRGKMERAQKRNVLLFIALERNKLGEGGGLLVGGECEGTG